MEKDKRNFEIRKMEWNEINSKDYYNLPFGIEYKNKIVPISRGSYDHTIIYNDNSDFIIYSDNKALNYAGIEIFDKELNKLNEIFFQNVNIEISDLKKDFFDYIDINKIKILMQYIQ